MLHLLIGPSNAGKSTYIERNELKDVYYASDLENSNIPDHGIVHYNLLYRAPSLIASNKIESEWDLLEEPIFTKILSSTNIGKVTVIVAPIGELKDRAASRQLIEPSRAVPGEYPRDIWSEIYSFTDLFAIYERLFDALDNANLSFEVIYSSSNFECFLPSERTYTHHNLRGKYYSVPSGSEVKSVVEMPGAEYQVVTLPGGRTNSGYDHLSGSRAGTFYECRTLSLQDRSILDIGCALGDMLFRAERYGASRLVGIELMAKRYDAAKAIGRLLRSDADFIRGDFLKIENLEQFDDVLALNIIHHISDFRNFIIKAATLARKRFIIEYPSLRDKRFQGLSQITTELSDLPLVGVSSSAVDQTFVFTRAAIERLVAEAGDFAMVVANSPITDRELLIFERA